MTNKHTKYHFYRCAEEKYAPGCTYFDHSNGIAGYLKLQHRGRYIGHMTADELDDLLNKPKHIVNSKGMFGHRSGYAKVSQNYDGRY